MLEWISRLLAAVTGRQAIDGVSPEWIEMPTEAPEEWRYIGLYIGAEQIGRVEVFDFKCPDELRAYGHSWDRRLGCFYDVEAAKSAVLSRCRKELASKSPASVRTAVWGDS